jgi:uncharacterized glyoxalase superfamily protein PhnB
MASSKKKTKSKTRARTQPKAKTQKTQSKAKAKAPARAATPAPRKESSAAKASTGLTLTAVSPSFTVDNIEKSLAWYRDVMGFAVGKRWEEKGTLLGCEVNAGSTIFMIGQDDWGKGKHRIKGAGFRLYCDTTQDVDRLADGIKARGGTLVDEPRDDEEWGVRMFTVQDPDGFKITIAKER